MQHSGLSANLDHTPKMAYHSYQDVELHYDYHQIPNTQFAGRYAHKYWRLQLIACPGGPPYRHLSGYIPAYISVLTPAVKFSLTNADISWRSSP